ncbi:MAG: C39 family peptidase [Acetanaerobacterium sp.]
MLKKFRNSVIVLILVLCSCVTTYAGGPGGPDSIDLGTKAGEDVLSPAEGALVAQKENQLYLQRRAATAAAYDIYVPVSRQIVGYYCGPAAAYMVIHSFGESVSSKTRSLYFYIEGECDDNCPYPGVEHEHYKSYTSPQITLADEMDTDYGGTSITSVKNTINDYVSGFYYALKYIECDPSSESELVSKISSTLSYGHPLVVWVEARLLHEYHNADFGGHYVGIEGINTSDGTIDIADPNYYTAISTHYTEDIDDVLYAIWDNGSTGNLIW